MPVSRIVRQLGGRWATIQKRASDHMPSIPPEGMSGPAYVTAVLHDLDPNSVSEILRLLHRRGLVWVRQTRGAIRVYAMRPACLKALIEPETATINALCASIVGHMLSLSRAEIARREAQCAEEFGVASEFADEAALIADRVCSIMRAHISRGLSAASVRKVLPCVFAEPAVDALTRWEPDLASSASRDVFSAIARPARSMRLPSGLDLEAKVLAIIERAGEAGVTRSDLMAAIRPKPQADKLSDIIARLTTSGRTRPRAGKLDARGRGQRYVIASALPANEPMPQSAASSAGPTEDPVQASSESAA